MPLQADTAQIRLHQARLAELKQLTPRPLECVLTQIGHMLVEISQVGALDRAFIRQFEGPGGNWKVSRFAAHGQPWIGVQWPSGVNRSLTDWLTTEARRCGMSTSRPDVPSGQLWLFCGAER